MSRSLPFILLTSLALVGCDLANKEEAQYDDARNPNIKQAQQDLDNNNPAAAIHDYEEALAANPKLAAAHYELGLIYGDKMSDPIGSIYHFKRYLELAPTSDKADQVKALIDKQSTAFAASLPNSPTQSADDYAKLQSDNASFKKQLDDQAHTIAQLQAQLSKHHINAAATASPAQPAPGLLAPAPVLTDAGTPASTPSATTDSATASTPSTPASTNTAPAVPPRAIAVDTNSPAATEPTANDGAPPANARSYKVVSGDSYWKIAKKMYPGDTKNGVEKIQEANKDTVGKPLKIGQVLVIP